MKPPPFDYVRPGTIDEALAGLARFGGNARLLAGGQSLLAMLNARLAHPQALIDINRIAGLDAIRVDGDQLVIGATARHSDVMASELVTRHCPLMAEAYPYVAHIPIRNRGTLGGNVCHADPASEMPAVLLASGAQLVAARVGGRRSIPAADFFVGMFSTALQPDEMLVEIRIPRAPANQGWAFEETSNRRGDFAQAAVAATLVIEGGRCRSAAIAVAGIEDRVRRLGAVEAALVGTPVDPAAIDTAAARCREGLRPNVSVHADTDYKLDLVDTLTRRALARARDRAGQR